MPLPEDHETGPDENVNAEEIYDGLEGFEIIQIIYDYTKS